MPWMEYKCHECGHEFKRLIMQGEKTPRPRCPECKAENIPPLASSKPLFEGISHFSGFGKDVN